MEKLCQEQVWVLSFYFCFFCVFFFHLSDLVLLTILLPADEHVHEGRWRFDDADQAGEAAASPFTMVTRRNLYAMQMERFVVFY